MIGKTLAHYEITAKLGVGGMGEVYRARDTRLGRDVALKILPPETSNDDTLRSRLEQEARAVAALQHPNIVTLFSVEEDQGRLFLTMELVRGSTLSSIVGAGLETARLLELALQLTDALGAAHTIGIVHRDLKPSNVMVDQAGRVKVLDFGLAKLVERPSPTDEATVAMEFTQAGVVVGTCAYVSPEQAKGEVVDVRSDVFSLGILLYEMATGMRPFEGDSPVSMLASIIKDPPRHSRRLQPRLAQIIERCLQKNPERRYASAVELHRELVDLKQALDSGQHALAPRTRLAVMRWLLLPAAVVLALLGWRLMPSHKQAAGLTTVPANQVIVVFPFENLGQPDDNYFADGMTDEIVSRLTSIAGIDVISRTTAINYDRHGKTLDQIGKDLGVGFVLEGTVRWDRRDAGSRVRVTPTLVRVEDGVNAWSSSYDRNIDDVFAIQSEIANQVASNIDASLVSSDRADPRRTTNLEAYDDFLQAKQYTQWGVGPTQAQLEQAAVLLEKALALDPDFALAHAELSMVHSGIYFQGFDVSEERRHLAERAADEAVRLQPNLAAAHLAQGLYHYRSYRDYPRALEQLETARRLEPGNGEILSWIGTIRKRQGRFEEAREILQQAIRLDPRNPTALGEMIVVCQELREYENTLQWADQLVQVDSSLVNRLHRARIVAIWTGDTTSWRAALEGANGQGRQWSRLLLMERRYKEALSALESDRMDSLSAGAWLYRAMLHHQEGDLMATRSDAAHAARIWEKAAGPDPDDNAGLALAYAYVGRRDQAMQRIAHAEARAPWDRDALSAANVRETAARVFMVLGDTSSAISRIDELLGRPGGLAVEIVEHDPRWDSLRDLAEFQKMLDRHR